ncbi:AroM family protein [Mesorhizobium sp. Z1-4]|uniref:AroM family protein n=1 Tax=Mesorhizobium sp. Z1-4 TaxID=2448478 RepID=UPI000FD910CA|nr:AroM family protein [Mesorhizobium sp. Z1-4]
MRNEERPPRILFITLGQSPRQDLLPDLRDGLGVQATISEIGLLDSLSDSEIGEFLTETGHATVVARLASGSWVNLSRRKISKLVDDRLAAIAKSDFELVVLMSTGIFREFESTCPTVNAQRALDAAVISLAAEGDTVGIVFPLERQIDEVEMPALSLFDTRYAYAAHQDIEELTKAAVSLKDCAYIVLNSVGYRESDRLTIAQLTGKPVILPRRIVMNSIRLILGSLALSPVAGQMAGLPSRLENLTARERQVMSLVCEGLSNKAIARQLDISHKTVEIHRSNILRKMQVPSSGALIRLIVKAGYD